MMRRIVVAGVICAAALGATTRLSAQRGNQSDATGPTAGLFSRGFVRAFAAPPAPPPVLVITPAMLDALCIERADALLVFASLPSTSSAERTALALLKGGPGADQAGQAMFSALVLAGARSGHTDALIAASNGLLAPGRADIPNVATAVARYNELVRAAPLAFLAQPPAELQALRFALGRLTAAANNAVDVTRLYPELARGAIGYADYAPWLYSGEALELPGATYFQFGVKVPLADRQLRKIGEHEGAWVLAEEPVSGLPKVVYVPIRSYCDVELVPYVLQEKVIKRQGVDTSK